MRFNEFNITEGAEDYAGIYSPEAIALGKRFCEHYGITDDTDVQLAVEIIDSYLEEFRRNNKPIDLKIIKSGVADAFRQVYRGMGPGPSFRKKFAEDSDEKEQAIRENLRKWFKEKWVRFNPQGKIMGSCARGSESEGKPKCLPQSKAHALGKKGRASAAAKKRREDPNPERRGKARNVATRVKEQYTDDDDWYDEEEINLKSGDYVRDRQDGEYGEIFRMQGDPHERRVQILDRDGRGWYISPDRLVAVDRNDPDIQKYFGKRRQRDMDEGWSDKYGGVMRPPTPYSVYIKGKKWKDFATDDHARAVMDKLKAKFKADGRDPETVTIAPTDALDEAQDACYHKVKSRYKVWPSAYASGALVQCRKKGAANWGNSKKK